MTIAIEHDTLNGIIVEGAGGCILNEMSKVAKRILTLCVKSHLTLLYTELRYHEILLTRKFNELNKPEYYIINIVIYFQALIINLIQ